MPEPVSGLRPARRVAGVATLCTLGLVLSAGVFMLAAARPAQSQARNAPAQKPVAGLAAARSIMAGAPLRVEWRGPRPDGEAAFALALPDAAPGLVITGAVLPFEQGNGTLIAPGRPGAYELRLLTRNSQGVAVIARQPITATDPQATIVGPKSVRRGTSFAARGSGPNGERDVVTIVRPDASPDAQDAVFLPSDSIEGRLEAPAEPGPYELRYVMIAPLTGAVVLARQPIIVE